MNPFEAFRSYSATRRELPLDRILARRDQVLQQLSQSYQALIEEESKQLIWVVEQGALSRAYSTAVEALRSIDFTVEDLEDMCLELDTNDGVTTPMGAPSGLFIAAMCNQVPANDIALNLHIFRHRWPFLGYRLPRGRRLYLDGGILDRPGLAGASRTDRVLLHYLPRSPAPDQALRLPDLRAWVEIQPVAISGLPRVDPLRLDRGRQAIERAAGGLRAALDRPIVRPGATARRGA